MNKTILIVVGVLALVVIFFFAFGINRQSENENQNQSSSQQADKIVENIENKIEQKGGGSEIVIPQNLQDCPSSFFQTVNDREQIVCDSGIKEPYCSYYTLEKDGVTKNKILEFTSECAVCRNHKRKGEVFIDSSSGKYTHLGYEKGACTQGMYKK